MTVSSCLNNRIGLHRRTLWSGCVFLLFLLTFIPFFSACSTVNGAESIPITVWVTDSKQAVVTELLEEYAKENPDKKYDFIVNSINPDDSVAMMGNQALSSADIIELSSDQIDGLVDSGCLLNLGSETDSSYVTRISAENGYFLYYDKSYFNERDIKNLDTILSVAQENDKYFSMDLSSGWYLQSFFRAASMSCYMDGKDVYCDWNRTGSAIDGVDLAEALISYTSRNSFKNCIDSIFRQGIEDGTIIAGVSGTWNAAYIEENFGENFGVAMLPSIIVNGRTLQMYTMDSYKAYCINANTKYPSEAKEIMDYLSSASSQERYMEEVGNIPLDYQSIQLSDTDYERDVFEAFKAQSNYSISAKLPENFWSPASILGTTLASGNADGQDLQELLDETVEKIRNN